MRNLKNLFLCGCASAMLASPPLCLVSCSDDDEEVVEQIEGGDVQGMLNKVMEIIENTSKGPQTVKEVTELASVTYLTCDYSNKGPIGVVAGRLNGEDITLITLGGEQPRIGQATTSEESTLAANGQPNDYLRAVTKLFKDGTVPRDKPVVVAGVCLGGMIAQQVLGEKFIMDNFKIKTVITFGTGIVLPLDRQGVKVVRFTDANDRVPEMAELILRAGKIEEVQMSHRELVTTLNKMDEEEEILRSGKYRGFLETHMLSYVDDPCWLGTDFWGDPNKTNVLELTDTLHFYLAPKVPHKDGN